MRLAAAAALAAAALLSACGGDATPGRTVTVTPSETFTPPSVSPVPSYSIETTVPDDPTPSTKPTRLTAKQRDKFIRVLYAKYTDEWVTNSPGDWLSLSRTVCNAYGRGVTDDELIEQLTAELSYGASRWFLATATTLVCPEYGG